MDDFKFDAIVIGAGHAGIEAGLALSRLGKRTLLLAISLESVGFLACNPSIGGTAKAHLVREIDALGGEMGIAADKTLLQLRMLNSSKGYAVQSLRAQVDKYKYHRQMKKTLENQQNLFLREGEAISIEKNEGIYTVKTRRLTYFAPVVILCCGVYLKSKIFVGDSVEYKGPSGFMRSEPLSDSLIKMGIPLRRFKTGTPARIKRSSIDLTKLEIQYGSLQPYSFSQLSTKVKYDKMVCYLGYTNQRTHEIIEKNLYKTPRKLGYLDGIGARYCPSIEDKIERFDRDRHPFFLEPEGMDTQEMYIQGISTSLPSDVQLKMYRSIEGFENCQIMRDAYAIEYDCIDPTTLLPSLMHKEYDGLFFAGQINGTSGYEEAAAQGLVAGINAARFLDKKEPFILTRDNSYIGVLIDDLVTKGTDEPYRMMTSRAEYRLFLRQDNADLRLTQLGKDIGLVTSKRYNKYLKKIKDIEQIEEILNKKITISNQSITLEQYIRRHDVTFDEVKNLDILKNYSADSVRDVFIRLRYSGYLQREERLRKEQQRLEKMLLPKDIDYMQINGLRYEAAEKLNKIKPYSIGQAARISGVNPADINVLIVRLKSMNKS